MTARNRRTNRKARARRRARKVALREERLADALGVAPAPTPRGAYVDIGKWITDEVADAILRSNSEAIINGR